MMSETTSAAAPESKVSLPRRHSNKRQLRLSQTFVSSASAAPRPRCHRVSLPALQGFIIFDLAERPMTHQDELWREQTQQVKVLQHKLYISGGK